MIFGFIAQHRAIWPVSRMRHALGVSRSGFFVWLNRPPGSRSGSYEVMSTRAQDLPCQRSYRRHRARVFNEPVWQLLGQSCDGELLLVAAGRTDCPQDVPDTRRGQGRGVRLPRAALPCEGPALDHRLSQTGCVRGIGGASLGACLRSRQQPTVISAATAPRAI